MTLRTRLGLILALLSLSASPALAEESPADWKLGVEIGSFFSFAGTLGGVSPTVGAGLERRVSDAWWLSLGAQGHTSTSERGAAKSSHNGAGVSVGIIHYANPRDTVRVGGALHVRGRWQATRSCGSLAGLGSLADLANGSAELPPCTDSDLTSIGLAADLLVAMQLTESLELRVSAEVVEGSIGWGSSNGGDSTDRTLALKLRPRLALYLAF